LDFGLKDKVAVVTGGSSGIGLATARLMLEAGARVAICGRDAGRLDQARGELEAEHGADRLLAEICDVLDAEQVARFRDSVRDRFNAADMLVNNAGRAARGSFAEIGDDAWREELDLKFFSIIRPTRAFLPLLEASGSGAIVCVNALLAQRPEPHMVATSAARAGVLNLAKSLSRELAPKGIRVNSILLGLIESGQWRRRYETQAPDGVTREEWFAELAAARAIPLGRMGKPEEPAAAIVFLASPLASYTTGGVIDVSGGQAHHV
jgi:NAD(P)-dependent dehydrogenase (short-subunit alcohol dehydrogenase family)